MITDINPLELPSLPLASRKKLQPIAAIYIVIAENDGILYVGRTINLANRWTQHHRFSQVSLDPNARIAWLECSDLALLPVLESALIKSLKPLLNRSPIPEIERPSKYPSQRKTSVRPIRFTEEEDNWLKQEAERRGVSIGEVVRDLLKERIRSSESRTMVA